MQEHVVEHHDLFPVGIGPVGGLGVTGDDRGLKLVGPGLAAPCRTLEQTRCGSDGLVVPARAILVFEEDEVSVRVESGVRAGPVQSNQGQKAGDLRLGWHEVIELGGQPFSVIDQIS